VELTVTDRLRIVLPAAGDGLAMITEPLAEELAATLRDTTARYVTIEGPPGTFCAGLDLDHLLGMPDGHARVAQHSFARMLHAIALAPCPVVALVDGVALGGGCGLAAASDLVLATPSSTFGMPEVLLGLVPAVVLPYAAQRMGIARARRLALDGGAIDAATALATGLVDEVTEDLETSLARHMKRMLRMDAAAQGEIKQLAARIHKPGAEDDAATRFGDLYESPNTQRRIKLMAAGEPPWLTEDES
jgi:enoyl-CoA hydratase/carnithine racemase